MNHTDPTETDEQRADRLETERDHAAGNHEYCGVTCEVQYPSDQLRNFVVAKGYPGTAGMLDELLRRAAVSSTPAETARTLRDRIAAALRVHYHCPGDLDPDGPIPCACGWMDPGPDMTAESDFDAHMADVVLAVLHGLTLRELEQLHRPNTTPSRPEPKTPPTDRADVLREAADRIDATREPFPIAVQNGITWATAELRRLAAETQQTEWTCPTCGPVATEPHPRLPISRCSNCKEHAPAETQQTQTEAPTDPGVCGHRSSDGQPCTEPTGHLGYHRNTRQNGTEWTSWAGDGPWGEETDMCDAEPPDSWPGDCWCTLPAGHEGDHRCEPCSNRHDAPGWAAAPAVPVEAAADDEETQ